MKPHRQPDRRRFIRNITLAAAAAAFLPPVDLSAGEKGVKWQIGCLDRPWVKWGFDTALRGMRTAGYAVGGLLTKTKEDPFVGAEATPEYLGRLKARLAASGLHFNMAAIRVKNDLPLTGQIADVRRQIEHARELAVRFLLTFGVDNAGHYENYYRVMADAAAHAQDRGVKLVIKPHGGGSGASSELARCLDQVNHPNFKVWYDAANVIYYTGKDPVEELKPIAQHVTGFCAKDCAGQRQNVNIQFGAGRVDFKAVFTELKKHGFNGPLMVECCELSDDVDQVTANARANREFLEQVLSSI